MMNDTYLYPYSSAVARERDELPLWRESHKANIACRDAIEEAIRQNFDGMHLDKNCITPVLEEYGYKRTAWVLANTLHELKWDGRFGHANKQWAERACIPKDINHNSDFVVRSHPAVLDGFVTFYRKAVQALNLFGAEHCVGDRTKQDFTGKVLVLSPEALREQYWGQDYQLLYAWMRASFQWSSGFRHLPLERRNSQMEPGGFHRCTGRKIPTGLGAGKVEGAENTGTDGRPHNGRYENEVRRILA